MANQIKTNLFEEELNESDLKAVVGGKTWGVTGSALFKKFTSDVAINDNGDADASVTSDGTVVGTLRTTL